MFDIGFWELVIIAMTALLVIGPDRLPAFARDAGRMAAKIRNFVSTAKRELERELELEEVNDLKNDIDHIDNLMKKAPDRILSDIDLQQDEDKPAT